MKINKKMTNLINKCKLLLVLVLMNTASHAQTSSAPAGILSILDNMYKNYDSVPYMSFDVKFTYYVDSIGSNNAAEQLLGTYTMAGKRTKYTLGDIDFMQNDSFFIAVYNKDKMILVDAPRLVNSGSQLPMRQQMDSLLKGYANHYTITNTVAGDTGKIKMVRADSIAQIDEFILKYDNRNKMLYQLQYTYTEIGEYDPETPSVIINHTKKVLLIDLYNYRFDNYDDSVYKETNYIYYENGVCKPAYNYKGFKIYDSRPVIDDSPLPAN